MIARCNAFSGATAVAAVGVVCLAAFLRVETLGQRPLWADELSVADFVVAAEREGGYLHARAHPRAPHQKTEADLAPLHTLLVYGMLAFDRSPEALRLPSVVSGVASVALLVALGALLYDRRTGLCAGLVMALSIYQINYAQDARAYALLVALSLAQYTAFVLFLKRPGVGWLVAFTLSGAASMYTHHLGVLNQAAIAAIAAVFFALDRRPSHHPAGRRRLGFPDLFRLVAAFAAAGLLYLPQLGNLLDFASSGVARPEFALVPSARFFHELRRRRIAQRHLELDDILMTDEKGPTERARMF